MRVWVWLGGICVKICIFEGHMSIGVFGWCRREWGVIWIVYIFDSMVDLLCIRKTVGVSG